MNDLLGEVLSALDAHLYRLALTGVLSVPDVAAALESDGWSSPTKYAQWFDKHVGPLLNTGRVSLSGENCYRFRCSILHQGTLEDQKPAMRFRRLFFVDPRVGGVFHMNAIGDALNIDVRIFCVAIVDATHAWLKTVSGSEPFESNLARCVRTHPEGLPPYFVGVPLIG